MKSLGGLLLMVGVGQAMFQASIWWSSGYWPHFTTGDLLAEIGVGSRLEHLQLGRASFLRDVTLGIELSFALMAAGVATTLARPAHRLYDNWHAARVIKASLSTARTHHPTADPLTTHH